MYQYVTSLPCREKPSLWGELPVTPCLFVAKLSTYITLRRMKSGQQRIANYPRFVNWQAWTTKLIFDTPSPF